jgi:hypothetical protein
MATRHIHGISWTDDLAWMESMKGSRWNETIKAERKKWNNEIGFTTDIQEELAESIEKGFSPPYNIGPVSIRKTSIRDYEWTLHGTTKHAVQIKVSPNGYIWYIEDTSYGKEIYTIFCMKIGHSTPIWKKTNVAPEFCIIQDKCYMLECKNIHTYWKLVSCDAFYGNKHRIHYEEIKVNFNLHIILCDSLTAYMTRSSGQYCDLFEINTDGILQIIPHYKYSRRFIIDSVKRQFLTWTCADGWKPSRQLSSFVFPPFDKATPEYIDTTREIYVSKWMGVRSVWRITKGPPSLLWKGVGQIDFTPNNIGIIQPGETPIWCNSITMLAKPIQLYTIKHVPFIIIPSKRGGKKGLLIIGYGAYGDTTQLNTSIWEPLLNSGWYLCFGFWRGGGDHTPKWEDAGRVSGRKDSLTDAYAVIRKAQELTGLGAEKTVLYGRSAGGLWVGGLCSKYPDGSLAKGAYMNVPYLDVLRTTTNEKLPLTNLELDEFGIPSQRISDMLSVIQWSPMETLPTEGITGMFQILRTGENDTEVYPYESVKWVTRARNGDNKRHIYLAFEYDEGHFIRNRKHFIKYMAEDFSLLNKLISKKI